MSTDTYTTMKITTRNRDALLRLGEYMQAEYPNIWGSTPSLNACVGFALTHLTEQYDANELLPID